MLNAVPQSTVVPHGGESAGVHDQLNELSAPGMEIPTLGGVDTTVVITYKMSTQPSGTRHVHEQNVVSSERRRPPRPTDAAQRIEHADLPVAQLSMAPQRPAFARTSGELTESVEWERARARRD